MSNGLPRFNLSIIERRRDRLAQQVFDPYVGEVVTGELLTTLTANIKRRMPAYVSRDAIFESIRHMAGRELTGATSMQTAWRLAGNLPQLKAGYPATPWASQHANEWVPVQITRAAADKNSRGRYGYNYDFMVLAGTPCTLKMHSFWKTEMIRFVAAQIGFSRGYTSKYKFQQATELVGLRLMVEIDSAKCRHEPVFYEVEFPSGMLKWNRDNVLKQRKRVIPCPRGYREQCHKCVVGYRNCVGATHKYDLENKFCTMCGEHDWFDPEETGPYCISCNHKETMRRQ